MRGTVVALLASMALSLSLAGCTQGDPGRAGDFHGSCPAWVKGLSTNVFQEGFQNSTIPQQKFDPEHPTGGGLREFQGHPLDLVDLDLSPTRTGQGQAIGVANGTLELRVFRSDNNKGIADQLLLHDVAGGPDGEHKDTWTFVGPSHEKAGVYRNMTLQVTLSEPDQAPLTDPIVLRWDFLPDDDPKTPSEAVMLYTAYFWYRTCNADGTDAKVR